MKTGIQNPARHAGVSLIEAVVSIGVLAVIAPIAMAAMLKAGEGGNSARAETRAPAIVEACLAELKTARDGNSDHLPALTPGEPFGSGQMLCLAFRRDGTLIGAVDPGGYGAGTDRIGDEDVSFLARLQGELDTSRDGFPEMLQITVSVEYPAVARDAKRRRLEFLTKLP